MSNNKNSYIAFDPTSINNLLIKKLNESEIFTDQNFQGSNLSSFLDIISYTFNTLLYYLNKTSSESMFSESQIYENMNRIVKILNYNPKGKMAQTVNFKMNSSLSDDNYILPRYSFLKIGSLNFSFAKDIYFTCLNNSISNIQNQDTDLFLFEGKFNEYPLYKALGASNEILFLNFNNTISIDHNNIDVYVKPVNSLKWEKWERSENLFLNKSSDKVFEVRYNPNKNYEIKFGDDINGKQLQTGDEVIVYYLQINENANTIAANSLKTSKISLFNGLNYQNIFSDTVEYNSTPLSRINIDLIFLNNDFPSSPSTAEESVEDIRKNAPKSFSLQQRLITIDDFKNYIINNYSNIFSDCYVASNEEYLNGHIKYLYDIGLKSPQLSDSILYNQVKFSNSCNFNNVYIYMTPINGTQRYISSSQKQIIINDLQNKKVITCDIVPMDPVYMNFDFFVPFLNEKPNVDQLDQNYLYIYKKINSKKSDIGIINEVIDIFKNYFDAKNVKFGQIININEILTSINNLDSVEKVQTYREDINTTFDGLSMVIWNKSYPDLDIKTNNFSIKMDYFQFPVFNNLNNLINKIKIINSSGILSLTDY
jgi:hypothetical protein